MNQKGFSSVILIAIIIAVLALGGIGFFAFSSGSSTEESSSEDATSTPEAPEESADTSGTLSGSYFDVLEAGDPVQCDWRLPEEYADQFQTGEGVMYTDGESRAFVKGTFTTKDIEVTSNTLIDEEFLYVWTQIPGAPVQGTKISRAQAEAADDELTEEQIQQGQEFRQQYSFECQPWTVDEAVLTLPADITFTELPV